MRSGHGPGKSRCGSLSIGRRELQHAYPGVLLGYVDVSPSIDDDIFCLRDEDRRLRTSPRRRVVRDPVAGNARIHRIRDIKDLEPRIEVRQEHVPPDGCQTFLALRLVLVVRTESAPSPEEAGRGIWWWLWHREQ